MCTLLLGNVAVNSAVSIFLGSLTAGVVAGMLATGLIVIFGEILPQAYFARHSLKYGAKLTWLVWIFLVILYPITKPISFVLDKLLGGETPTAFSKREMRLLLREQHTLHHSDIDKSDYELMKNSLEFSKRTVRSVMTPLKNTFLLNQQRTLDQETLEEIHENGHSRIPIFHNRKQNVVGVLFAKDLISLDPEANVLVKEKMRKKIHFVRANKKLDDVMKLFQKWHTHISVVRDSNDKVVGIITLEDVLEELIGEIVDEHDQYIDMRSPTEEL